MLYPFFSHCEVIKCSLIEAAASELVGYLCSKLEGDCGREPEEALRKCATSRLETSFEGMLRVDLDET